MTPPLLTPARRLRVGVVGCGSIGKNHARIYASLPHTHLAAIYEPDPATAAAISAAHGCVATSSLEDFSRLVEAASVATPTESHRDTALLLMQRGIHVLVEKPIASNTAHAQEMSDLARRSNLVLQVGHIERFNPALDALENLLSAPRFIEAHRLSPFPNRSTDIGVVLDLMIHDLEVILHLVRSPVTSLDAVGVPILSHREDIANVRLRFQNGCVANITASRVSPEKMRKIRIFQEDTYISLDYQAQAGEIFRRRDGAIHQETVIVEKDEPLRCELASFAHCCLAGAEPRVTGPQATAALELAVRITRQIAEQNAPGAPVI